MAGNDVGNGQEEGWMRVREMGEEPLVFSKCSNGGIPGKWAEVIWELQWGIAAESKWSKCVRLGWAGSSL